MAGCETDEANQHQQALTLGSEVEVSNEKGAWFRATIIEYPDGSASRKRNWPLVEYKTLVTEDGSKPLKEYVALARLRRLPPAIDDKQDFVEGDVVDVDYKDGWWTGVIKKVMGNSKYRVFFENPLDLIEFEHKNLRFHQDLVGEDWVRPERQQTTASTFSSGNDVEVNFDKQDLDEAWLPAVVVKENEDNTYLVKYQKSESEYEQEIVDSLHIRLPHPSYSDGRYKLQESVVACDIQEELEHTPKNAIASQLDSPGAAKGIIDPAHHTTEEIIRSLPTPSSTSASTPSSTSARPIRSTRQHKDGELGNQRKYPIRRRGRPSKSHSKSQLAAAVGKEDDTSCSEEEGITKEAELPLTIGSSVTRLGSSVDNNTVQQDGGSSHKRKRGRPRKFVISDSSEGNKPTQHIDAKNETSVTVRVNEIVPKDSQGFPFVKSSPLWETITSMSVFSTMPQNPHFEPLNNSKEEYREGLAIGSMVTFSNLVNRISNLQFEDPESTFTSILDSLIYLEKHGFDVTVLRTRVNELVSIKDRQEQFVNESKNCESMMMEHTHEKTLLVEEMDNIAKKISGLQQKHALLTSKLEKRDVDIEKFKLDMAMNKSIETARLDFEKLAAAPL